MIACFARIKENTGATFLKPESCVWECAPQKLSKDARWSRQRVENFSPGPNQTLPREHSNMQITLICIQTELSRLKGVNVNNSLVFYITCAKLTKMAQFGKYAFWPKHFTPNLQFFNVRKCKPVKSMMISISYHDISISLHALILDILQLSPMPWSTQVNKYHLPSYHCNNLKKKKCIMH